MIAVPPPANAVVPTTVQTSTAAAAIVKLKTRPHDSWYPPHQRHAQAAATTGEMQLT